MITAYKAKVPIPLCFLLPLRIRGRTSLLIFFLQTYRSNRQIRVARILLIMIMAAILYNNYNNNIFIFVRARV
jgi:hypothetical protein